MILNVFLNKLRDRHNTNETKSLLGNDNTPAVEGDSALGNLLQEFDPISSFTGNVGEITKIYQVNAGELIGDSIVEVGFTTAEVLQSRTIITPISKTANEIIQIRHKTTYRKAV